MSNLLKKREKEHAKALKDAVENFYGWSALQRATALSALRETLNEAEYAIPSNEHRLKEAKARIKRHKKQFKRADDADLEKFLARREFLREREAQMNKEDAKKREAHAKKLEAKEKEKGGKE